MVLYPLDLAYAHLQAGNKAVAIDIMAKISTICSRASDWAPWDFFEPFQQKRYVALRQMAAQACPPQASDQ